MPEKKKRNGAAKADPENIAAEIHQLVGRVHRLNILMGRQARPETHDIYQKELDAKNVVLNKLAEKHQGLINKELAALDYVPK